MDILIFAYFLDLILGDPEKFPHPVRFIGKLISSLERYLLNKQRPGGILLTILVVGITFTLSFSLIHYTGINHWLGWIIAVYLGYTVLSIKDLRVKAQKVTSAIEQEDLDDARRRLKALVGRDTHQLSEEQIVRATLESIAENTNDGIVAPLFYFILGGPALALTYKAINTLDSMVGYRNEKYFFFGWASAKLDDLANFIPARICGFLISVAALSKRRFTQAFTTMCRDGRKHTSPNSGISEAAMAGALGVTLGGPASYGGETVDKPYIGKEERKMELSLVNEALSLSLATSFLMLVVGIVINIIPFHGIM